MENIIKLNNKNKIEILPYELDFITKLKREYLKLKIKILNEIIRELTYNYKLLKKE
uniref:Uncharacterized protein n=1 Tax=viral metagenome TaxID=1070528 RepID=A0A6C0BSB2_9ZZZZ